MKKITTSIMALPILLLGLIPMSQAQTNVNLLGKLNGHPSTGYNDCWGYTAPDGREYALLGVRNGTSVIDITNAANPVEIDFFQGQKSTWRDMKTYKNYSYTVNEQGGGMLILDLSGLPNSVRKVKDFQDFQTSHSIYIEEEKGILYAEGVNSSGKGVRAYSLADPENPELLSTFAGETHDFHIVGDLVWVCEGNKKSISQYDLSDPRNPRKTGSFSFPNGGYVHNNWVSEDGKYMMTTEETSGKTVKMWNIENFNNAVVTDEYLSSGGVAHNVFMKGNFAYIAHYSDGFIVVDISDPNNIKEAGEYDTHPATSGMSGAWGVYPYFPSGKVILSDVTSGLYIFDFIGDEVAPEAAFKASSNQVCNGAEISFSDQSVGGTITEWEWTFEGGTPATSTAQNPTVTYNTSGEYDVSLKVKNSFGDDEFSQSNMITVSTMEQLEVSDAKVCAPGGEVTVMASTDQEDVTITWFAEATSNNYLASGNNYTTNVSETSTFYVEGSIGGGLLEAGKPNTSGDGGNHGGGFYLIFDALSDFTLKSAVVIAQGAGDRTLVLRDASENEIMSKTINIPNGESRIDVNWDIEKGKNYQIGFLSDANLYRNNDGVNYPYVVESVLSINESSAGSDPFGFYYYLYDWEIISGGFPGCSTGRMAVNAMVENCTGIEDDVMSTISIYPNPSNGRVFLNTQEPLQVNIVDQLGKSVYQSNHASAGALSITLEEGLYSVILTNKEGLKGYEKLIIK